MELSKKDTGIAKGVAVLGMVLLHLFCRLDNLPYQPLVWIGNTPLVYYIGLFGDICVPIFCFCSGYAHYLIWDKQGRDYKKRIPDKLWRFLLNYWLVIVLFSVIALCMGDQGMPGSFSKWIGNMLLYGINYNGAHWFVLTYVILLVLSPCLAWIAKKTPWWLLVGASGGLYMVAYVFRFVYIMDFHNPVANWIWEQTILFGTSQFSYMLAMVCRKQQWITGLRNAVGYTASAVSTKQRILKILLCVVVPVAAFGMHAIQQALLVAPVTAMATLLVLFLWRMPKWLSAVLDYFGKHSTNIWLVHMFFYAYIFKDLVFCVRWPLAVLPFMLVLSLAASYVIGWLEKGIHQLLSKLKTKNGVSV